jgi:hypothetical protein
MGLEASSVEVGRHADGVVHDGDSRKYDRVAALLHALVVCFCSPLAQKRRAVRPGHE